MGKRDASEGGLESAVVVKIGWLDERVRTGSSIIWS